MRGLCALVLLAVASLLSVQASPAAAQTFESIFSKTYTRQTGTPVTASDTFTACDPTGGTFRLVVLNGPNATGQIGTDPVSSGTVSVNGIEVVHERDFNQNVTRIDRPLSGIQASNRLDVSLRSGPGGTIRVTVEAAQSCGDVRIASPAPGSLLTEPTVLVRGTAPRPAAGGEVGVTVNGVPALVADGKFGAIIPVDQNTTIIAVTATDGQSVLGTDRISVTVRIATPDLIPLTLRARPAIGVAPHTATFSLTSETRSVQATLDADGNGSIDFQGSIIDSVGFTYTTPGLYFPLATMTDATGATRTATAGVLVYDGTALDALLQAKWRAMKDALRAGDVARAVTFIAQRERARYQNNFLSLTTPLSNIDAVLTDIQFVQNTGLRSEYHMLRVDNGITLSYFVLFSLDEDGIWRLQGF